MLKNKKFNTQEDWECAYRNIEKIISKDEIDGKISLAVNRLRKNLAGRNPVCCWSGGKDAQVARFIYEAADYHNFVHGNCPEIEYPAFIRWVEQNKPKGTVVYGAEVDFDFLNSHPNLIFPADSNSMQWYYGHINQQAWYKYCKEFGADTLVLGHRVKDGNQCGNAGVSAKGDILKVMPIFDFTHEEVFAVIHYYNLPLPPIYGWKDGFYEGTHVVLARSGKNGKESAMRDIMEIDPTILPRLAGKIKLINDYFYKKGVIV